tara:strand:+ start:25780 stop:26271 length:492 start_codon:yes stop_codon:yes gene_type:complete
MSGFALLRIALTVSLLISICGAIEAGLDSRAGKLWLLGAHLSWAGVPAYLQLTRGDRFGRVLVFAGILFALPLFVTANNQPWDENDIHGLLTCFSGFSFWFSAVQFIKKDFGYRGTDFKNLYRRFEYKGCIVGWPYEQLFPGNDFQNWHIRDTETIDDINATR